MRSSPTTLRKSNVSTLPIYPPVQSNNLHIQSLSDISKTPSKHEALSLVPTKTPNTESFFRAQHVDNSKTTIPPQSSHLSENHLKQPLALPKPLQLPIYIPNQHQARPTIIPKSSPYTQQLTALYPQDNLAQLTRVLHRNMKSHQNDKQKAYHIYDTQGRKQTLELLLQGNDKETWSRSASNEFGRLTQGNTFGIKGTNTMDFITKDDVPKTVQKSHMLASSVTSAH